MKFNDYFFKCAHPVLTGWALIALLVIARVTSAQVNLEAIKKNSNPELFYTYYSIACSDSKNLTIVGYLYDPSLFPAPSVVVLIERTNDGGLTWKQQNSIIPNQESVNTAKLLRKVIALDSLTLFAVGDSGLIVNTTDAGITWTIQESGTKNPFWDVSFADKLNGLAISPRGDVVVTTNGGKLWEMKKVDTSIFFSSCKAFSNMTQSILEYGKGPLYSTSNLWDTWGKSTRIPDTPKTNIFRSVKNSYFYDPMRMLAYGVHYVEGGVSITKGNAYMALTTDGGQTWVDYFDKPSSIYRGILSMSINGSRGVACGVGPGILFTTDGGLSWHEDSLSYTSGIGELLSSSFPDGDDAYFVTDNTTVGGVLKLNFQSLLKTEAYEEVIYGTHLYPNPASESVTIRTTYSDAKEIYLFDARGRKVMTIPCEGKNEVVVSCNDLPIGIYKTVISWKNRSIPGKQLLIMR